MQAFFRLTLSLCAAATNLDHEVALDEQHYHQTCLLQTRLHHLGLDTAPSSSVDATSREGRRHGLQQLWQHVRSAFDELPADTGDVLLAGDPELPFSLEFGRVSFAALRGGLEEDARADRQRLDEAFARVDALSGAVAEYASYAAHRVGDASALHASCRDRELQALRDCVSGDGSAPQDLAVGEGSGDGAGCRRGLSKELSLARQACGVLQLELEWTACNVTKEALYNPAAVGQEYQDAVDQYTALETETDMEQLIREEDSALASQLGCLQEKMQRDPEETLSREWLDECSLAAGAEAATLELRHKTLPPLAALPHQPCTEEFVLEHYSALSADVQLYACNTCEQIEQSKPGLKAAAEAWHRTDRRQGPPPSAAASLAIA